jgi:hypothetical protein
MDEIRGVEAKLRVHMIVDLIMKIDSPGKRKRGTG